MKIIFNRIFKLNIFNNFNVFFAKKLIKYSKIFFVKTNIINLPVQNHPLKLDFKEELKKITKYKNNSKIAPFISYSHLIDLLTVYSESKKKIIFYDYGAGNLDLYFYIKKKIKSFIYIYHDQQEYVELANAIKQKFKLNNLIVYKNNKIKKLDFVYFGGVIQYLKNYKKEISNFFGKTKYIIISQTPFFSNNLYKNIIVKQLNLFPIINYLYFININFFIKFMKKNNYVLLNKSINKVIKFVNFKNFERKYHDLQMYDLIFKYEKK